MLNDKNLDTQAAVSVTPETEVEAPKTPLDEKAKPARKKLQKVPAELIAPEKPAEPQKKSVESKKEELQKTFSNLKVFNRWPLDITVNDAGLKNYMNLTPVIVPWSAGRNIKKQFWKSKKSIIERLMVKLMVTGHKGKKHYWSSGIQAGKLSTQYNIIKKTFEIIENRAKKNPVEVFIRALEAGSPREGVATIEYGGVRYPKAADIAPQRRIDLALRWMTQGAFIASRKNKKHIWDALADEITATANNDQQKSNCLTKRQDLERQAGASR